MAGVDAPVCVEIETMPDAGTVMANQTSPLALYVPQDGVGGAQVELAVALSVVAELQEQEAAGVIVVALASSSLPGSPTLNPATRVKNCPREEGPACTSYSPNEVAAGMETEMESWLALVTVTLEASKVSVPPFLMNRTPRLLPDAVPVAK